VAAALARDGMDASKLHVIHNGIDPERFRPLLDSGQVRRKFNLPADAPLVVVVGQLTPWKGHDVLLNAWGELRKRPSQAMLLIVGSALWSDDAKWEDRLKSLADELELDGSVRFLWRQSDVASIVGAASILVVPSLAEPFGRVALEAMALSKPVVGTNAGGLPEVVADGVTGLLVPPADAKALADAMERLLTDAQLAEQLGRAGAARVRQSFHINRTAQLTQDVYDRLLQTPGGR
jgi:glycosyltransferase involved in cell wall biosynthesis